MLAFMGTGRRALAASPAATDCHVHVFDPARFPYAAGRRYTPAAAPVDTLLAFEATLGANRVVLVQPSVYGTDNRCLLDALLKIGLHTARGIAVIDPSNIVDADLRAMRRSGVVGVRANLSAAQVNDPAAAVAAFTTLVARVAPFDLGVEIYAPARLIEALAESVAQAKVPVVFDHFGGLDAAQGTSQPGYAALASLLRAGKAWVKLSAPYRASHRDAPYPDIADLARGLIDANSRHVVWGSDWPHTGVGGERDRRPITEIEPFLAVDDVQMLAATSTWTDAKSTMRALLRDNAQRLYHF